MNNYKTYIYLALLTLLSCKGNDGNEPLNSHRKSGMSSAAVPAIITMLRAS